MDYHAISVKFTKSLTYAVNGHVEQLPWPDNGKESVNALEDGDHHLVLVLGSRLVLRMCARMNDSVHVQVQIVELHLVGIGFRTVHRGTNTVNGLMLQ